MINIDDFVREKLNGHPEKDDSAAAWLKMKDLLDKEMPEKAAPFLFKWRKPVAIFGVALLISALCVGGYELNALRELNKAKKIGSENNLANSQNNNQTQINNSNNNLPQTNISITEPNTKIKNNLEQGNQTIDNKALKTESALENQNNNSKKAEVATNYKNTIGAIDNKGNKENENEANRPKSNSSNHFASSNVSSVKKPSNKKIIANDKSDLNQPSNDVLSNGVTTPKSNNANNTAKESSTAALGNRNNKLQNSGNKIDITKIKADSNQLVNNNDKNSDNKAKQTEKDSIPAITVITKEKITKGFPRKTTNQYDTIANGKIAVANNKTNSEAAIAKKNEINNLKKTEVSTEQNKKAKSNKANRKDEFAGKTPNSTSKSDVAAQKNTAANVTKKEKSKAAKWFDNLNLPQAAADAKRDLGNAKFYAGFSAGANYSISNSNNFQGVQFGPSGELVFNKHWSLFGAVKYFNRSGGKKTVNDSYGREIANNTPDSTSGANWYYKVHTDSTNRFFNFSTLHSFELPITIRYAFKKFYVMTGINLAYYLGVNVEEVSKNLSPVNLHLVQTNSTKPILSETKATLFTNDFGSKFAMGYVLGAGYQMTPSWQADLRMVNNFWDNSKGDGAKKLSKDFYKLPSLQITIGYQFNRGKSKPTFGPTDPQ